MRVMSKNDKVLPKLHLEYSAAAWRDIRGLKARLEKAALLTLSRLPKPLQPVARNAGFSVLLTTNTAVRRLNREFRGLDKPTNVLSFPHFTPRQLTRMGRPESQVYIGDIAMAYQYVVDEAEKERKLLKNHVTHLMIHGILHLFGYDHQTNAAALRMENLEKTLMAELGLPDPYAPLAAPATTRRTVRKATRT